MGKQRLLPVVALVLFCAPLLSAQSLSELSKKEKERREALKGRHSVVITNADLAKSKKKAGLETPAATSASEPAAETPVPDEPPAAAGPPEGDSVPAAAPAEAARPTKAELLAKYAKAKEYADLLELKMGSLWQEFYGLVDTKPKDAVQQEIALTFDKLEKARADEAAAKKELDAELARTGEANAPAIWIR